MEENQANEEIEEGIVVCCYSGWGGITRFNFFNNLPNLRPSVHFLPKKY